ncbi:type III pantothenate kinase [Fulvivirga maritima]|uniref:type III pantothenate kinase n=1 Tax=Fulvivirga maritima TaxID=2904247 RepID=UPI001F40E0B8|nr:type III pantothenate kinase [Fulvivirga maritima]UII28394.1 type III pantothenate kinase [Fulvivirga maritima]
MFLSVDIGNTNVVFGLHNGTEWTRVWRIATKDEAQELLAHSLDKHLDGVTVNEVAISSVVPFFTHVIKRKLSDKLKITPYLIGPDSYDALPIEVLHPDNIGSDLVADALAAYEKYHEDCMVVDFGTALTFTIVADKKIKGVNIAPGLKTAMKALATSAVRLNEIPLELPESVIGFDTTSAIQSGILWGYVGLVEKMIERIEKELNTKLKIIATGGLSKVLEPLQDQFDAIEPHTTLEGVRLIYLANKN